MQQTPRRVVIVGYEDAELLDIACPTDAMDAANRYGARPAYDLCLASLGQRPVRCVSGLTLAAQASLERLAGPIDTLIVAGGMGHEAAAANASLVAHIRRLARESRRVASVCSGATVLAATGLLDGRRATTHWMVADQFARTYPRVTVDPSPLYIRDGDVYTSAGVTSALDLTLALIEDDHGPDLARNVARVLVTYLHRPGNQAQVSMFIAGPTPEHHLVRALANHINSNLDGDLGTVALAARAGVSTRHLTRLFDAHVGTTPARYVRSSRVEAAAHLLVSTRLPLGAVARRCGFTTGETLRQAFLDHYDVAPSAYRSLHTRSGTAR
ncbi:GlxA family transcriptional regulator [Solihabitans fulvus]|uniref:GlxA family transcriptional regulator n=1 Tax=Solihabitans fulvus TaxID=1892852 RepID=A0A5B2WVJ7_9PSEU|nr:GlxA family transcriptional regulator [Solihabitans fulvus]KAA2254469.1 GlxA family transcriptional regulator [Solihabitans fulvus]